MRNRYFQRAAKYFAYLIILFAVLFGILIATNFSSWEIFLRVWTSNRIWLLIVAFVILPLLYPFFGFVKRDIRGKLEDEKDQALFERVLTMSGYVVTERSPGRWVARATGSKRFTLFYEDHITLTADGSYVTVEGPRKEVVRIEYRISTFR